MVRDVTPMKMIPRGGNMVTLRVLFTQTSAVGPSASAKHAGVVADADTHTLHTITSVGPAQAPGVPLNVLLLKSAVRDSLALCTHHGVTLCTHQGASPPGVSEW